jgi:hypothetical protein
MLRTLVLATLVLAGCQGDQAKCETACRNGFALKYWQTTDALIAAAPADKRDAMRREKLADFEQQVAQFSDTCVQHCVSANDTKTTDCLIAAKTAADLKNCADD